jgi:hypothetical protein
MLAAHAATTVSVEAAEELVRLMEDKNTPRHSGKDLPQADKETLLRRAKKAKRLQKT